MSYSIVTDTSANLPTPILEAANVPVIPFHYTYNGAEHACLDTEAFDGKLYYDAIRGGTSVSTSQINPQAYIDCFEPLLDAGQDILFIGMSSGISGSFRPASRPSMACSTSRPSPSDAPRVSTRRSCRSGQLSRSWAMAICADWKEPLMPEDMPTNSMSCPAASIGSN